ncbi:putative B3 domain-containing protein [Prunus yedoensis var. nudiflora]|uniref:Putative B3 domain-containing protein n=1 Tax=Prunus yedoensis var. nudiflora TaxID=2094558 RepID=A0A314Z5V5_PRUYE|nr:putative B3 domain-containing protein [Prunus yedoensis var. nudiflora]
MARKLVKPSLNKQSFFKILLGDFSQRLRIPPKFVKNFNVRPLHKCALSGPSGIRWTVELEERENGLFFQDGWQGFVKDHHLEDGDFLVFKYDAQVKEEIVDRETRNYNENCQNKAIVSGRRSGNYVIPGRRPANDHVGATSTERVLFKPKYSCFMITFTRKLRYGASIPKEVAVTEGLLSKKSMMIQDPTGRSWPVKLRVRGKLSSCRVVMSTGLVDCCNANQIIPGTLPFLNLSSQVWHKFIFSEWVAILWY